MERRDQAGLRDLLGRASEGDRTALEPAFSALHPVVLSLCRRLLDATSAEDAAQEALITLFANLSQYDAERDPIPWSLAFAANACRTSRKRQSRRREQSDPPESASDSTPEDMLFQAELRAAVQQTLVSLSALDEETLHLAMGDRPPGATFRKRLERASERFRTAWSLR